ncbi:MAG TPA: hypothetical protein VFG91_07350 [Woeseiaceae bacterium]|nr:hypothetical protein [Woeseiaceae bacterium]
MRIHRFILPAACVVLVVSFWKRNDVPAGVDVLPPVEHEPIQSPTARPVFSARWGGVEYRVEPQFAYDLYGMVVSYRQHDDSSRMHRRANDHLNMADLCVVWGDNAQNDYLPELEFWNGVFTCNVKTSDSQAWASFNLDEMSNNHLISDDPRIRERVSDVAIGDQVHVRGVLASYGTGGNKRGTSTTRSDTGDGACETIYVETFEIVAEAVSYWRLALYASLAVIGLSLVLYFRRPYRPY